MENLLIANCHFYIQIKKRKKGSSIQTAFDCCQEVFNKGAKSKKSSIFCQCKSFGGLDGNGERKGT